jgi:tetratricopeptide (TPR) repeat protein
MPLLEMSSDIFEKCGDLSKVAVGLLNLAVDQIKTGSLKAAKATLSRQIDLCCETKDLGEAIGRRELGRLLTYQGAWIKAIAELDQSLELFAKDNNIQSQGVIHIYRAYHALARTRDSNYFQQADRADTALIAAKKSLAFANNTAREEFSHERDYVRAHWLLGAAHRLTPDLSESDHHLSEALSRCRAINMVDHEADILLDFARLRRDQNNLSESRCLAEEAYTIATRSGYVLQGADIHLFLAELSIGSGNLDKARELAQEALRLATCDGGDYTYKVAYDEAQSLLTKIALIPSL